MRHIKFYSLNGSDEKRITGLLSMVKAKQGLNQLVYRDSLIGLIKRV